MESKTHSQAFLKKRKFLMVFPLLTLPFIIILFALLGGGKGDPKTAGNSNTQGLSLKLPDAHFKKGKEKDKLGMYEESNKDSSRRREEMKNDPYYKLERHDEGVDSENKTAALQSIFQHSASQYNQQGFSTGKRLNTSVTSTGIDTNEEKVMQKLALLKTELKKKSDPNQPGYSAYNNQPSNPDIEKLQKLVSTMKQGGAIQSDPELDRINGMLDKVMYIQHPEKMEDSMKRLSLKNKPQSYSVQTIADDTAEQNGFYGLSEPSGNENTVSNAIRAVVEENQVLVSGAVVKLRLLQDIYIHGSCVAKNQLVYGVASLSNERLKISINSIRCSDNILPVSLDVYDMDGLQGIYVPGSINRDVGKESADEAISTLGLTSLDPSLGAQAASAGIQAAKTLMSKKIKLVRVNLKAGYQVLLKDNNQK